MRLLADTRPLRQSPPFRRLWMGTTWTAMGSTMTGFAVTLQVYQLTHSAAAVGALGATLLAAQAVAGLPAAALAALRLVAAQAAFVAVDAPARRTFTPRLLPPADDEVAAAEIQAQRRSRCRRQRKRPRGPGRP